MTNEIEIYQLITMLDDFFDDGSKWIFDVGEMVGCNLIRYAAEAAVRIVPFQNILFVSGYQDAVYADNKLNHIYWKCLFDDYMIDSVHNVYDSFSPAFRYNRNEYIQNVMVPIVRQYSVMIINQAQLIPHDYLKRLCESFSGKIVRIFDPYDICGTTYDVPLRCIDTFEKLPLTIGYARSLYGANTRCINKRARNTLTVSNIRRRSIGKLDENQYVTSDMCLLEEIHSKQTSIPFRKNYKVIVDDNRFNIKHVGNEPRPHSVGKGSILHIVQGGADGRVRCRLHSSRVEFDLKLVYTFDPWRTTSNSIQVKPANIITPADANLHYFKHVIYVTTNESPNLTIREQYTLIKQSQNLTIVKTK